MQDIVFIDDMKKERRLFIVLLVLTFILTISFLLIYCFEPYFAMQDMDKQDIFKQLLFYFILFLLCLYGFLYETIYNLTVTKSKIYFKTLFRKREITIKNIKQFKYKRHIPSKFYVFKIIYSSAENKEKKLSIGTKHKDELLLLLKEIGACQL